MPRGMAFAVDLVSDRVDREFAEEWAHLLQAAAHRQGEFSTGRACARQALATAGAAACAIPPDAAGVPIWPESYLASISHSRGLAAAVAGEAAQFEYLGLDLEKTNRLSPVAIRHVLHPDESEWVGGDQFRATVLFSVKEAFYKAQYPRWRCQANFNDLCFAVDDGARSLRVTWIAERFPAGLREQVQSMQFRYSIFGDYIVSLCWL